MIDNSSEFKKQGWRTVSLIGRGSFGAVYEIQRDVFGETEKAALKVITIPKDNSEVDELYNAGYDDESIRSKYEEHLKGIVSEYSVMRKLSACNNVVKCEDVHYEPVKDGFGWHVFIRMELLTALSKVSPDKLSEENIIKLAKDLCTALIACKKYNIIHRDIKPQNIFISSEGDFKLGDFGVAKTAEKTMFGTFAGTEAFMAPEVYFKKPYGASADIYSLGLNLYWLLNNRRMPFIPTDTKTITFSMEEKARDRRLAGEVLPAPLHGSEQLKKIVLKACSFNPAQRYSSPDEMMSDLSKITFRDIPPSRSANQDKNSSGNEYSNRAHYSQTSSYDVKYTLNITPLEAAKGCKKSIISEEGHARYITIGQNAKNNEVLRIEGGGRRDPITGIRGDAYIIIHICSSQEKEASELPKQESISTACVISVAEAKSGCEKTITLKNNTTKVIQIPENCKNEQIVSGVKIYVHDIKFNPGDLKKLPDVVLDIYANQSTHLVRNTIIAFIAWLIFGMASMQVPVMAVGVTTTIIIVVAIGVKKGTIIESAKRELELRKKQR